MSAVVARLAMTGITRYAVPAFRPPCAYTTVAESLSHKLSAADLAAFFVNQVSHREAVNSG